MDIINTLPKEEHFIFKKQYSFCDSDSEIELLILIFKIFQKIYS